MSAARKWLLPLVLSVVGIAFLYPLLWMFFASLKPNTEVFSSLSLVPSSFVWESYTKGWHGFGRFHFGHFLMNTFVLVVPTVMITAVSSVLIAYGFARFAFPLRNVLFALMISSLMLPESVIMIPRYLVFRSLDWLNTYLTFYVPALLGVNAFFIYLLVQFFRGIPKELDEAAIMDGCSSFRLLARVLVPLTWPAVVSVCLFQFLWTWNEFFNALLYISSTAKFPVALALRIALDGEGIVNWNQVLAMSVLAVLPCIAVFFAAQRYFVDGIATTGLKG